jgi:chitin synthase
MQIAVAFILSTIYAMVMIAVLIGIMVQITEDGPLAPSSLFFFIVALQMIVTAMLHPREFGCLPFGVVYYITVPSMYMLLIIYSLFNMNNVSWGTREDPKPVQMVNPNEVNIFILFKWDSKTSVFCHYVFLLCILFTMPLTK